MEMFELVMTIILYILGTVLLLSLIFLVIKLIKTLTKVDKVVDDINAKSTKLNGVFNLIDKTTETIELVNDKISAGIISLIGSFFRKKGKEDGKND